jgi:hypothetical protein
MEAFISDNSESCLTLERVYVSGKIDSQIRKLRRGFNKQIVVQSCRVVY